MTKIVCTCGNQIGEEIYIEGNVAVVQAGGALWHDLRGHCIQCGAPFYFSTKGTLVQRALISHKKIRLQVQGKTTAARS